MLKKRTILFAPVFVALVVFLLLLLLRPNFSSSSFPPLPNPNGYDDLLKAGEILEGFTLSVDQLNDSDLRMFVSTNSEALRLVRLGLSRQCAVNTALVVTNFAAVSDNLRKTKRLAWLLAAEGQIAELDGRGELAGSSYAAIISIGNEISRGGALIDRLVGIAIEAVGYVRLVKLTPKLQCEQTRSLITALELVDQKRASWEEIKKNEKAFFRYHLSESGGPWNIPTAWWDLVTMLKSAKRKHETSVAQVRLLATEMALRCFRAHQGHAPERLNQLVPQWLQRLPMDPFNGEPLVYRPQGTNWLLYSVGPDGVDDGGKPVDRLKSAKGDLLSTSLR